MSAQTSFSIVRYSCAHFPIANTQFHFSAAFLRQLLPHSNQRQTTRRNTKPKSKPRGNQTKKMSFSGALGRGTYHSVIAGTSTSLPKVYHSCANEIAQLNQQHRVVQKMLLIRDAPFNNKFPEAAKMNGLYRLQPKRRHVWQLNNVMTAIRKRSMLLARVRRQQAINAELISEAEKQGQPDPRQKLVTADSAVYFAPKRQTAVNACPNFWQHESQQHVVPKPRWERHPELGGITRVHDTVSAYSADY